MLYDVFICHATEDKEDFVRPLAALLKQQHIDVWYDEFSLSVGDSLAQKIDEGLARSRFGIVVLSPNFFDKPWARRELTGLTAREMHEGQDIILPIWHRVGVEDVIQYSPPMADKRAIVTSNGINAVLRELIQKIRPEESPLVVARDTLDSLNFDPPAISDEWWLDVVEYKEFLKTPDINFGKRWIFPLPFQDEDRGRERGLNIVSTALQIDWSFEAEELNLSSLTHPDEIHAFLRRWPGLLDCARNNPGTLALYAPQLTIPGFDQGFEGVFDELIRLPHGDQEVARAYTYGQHSTVEGKEPLCGDVIAYRHSQFGNYSPAELAKWYFCAHDGRYLRHGCDAFSGLVWLLSSASDWLPEKYRAVLTEGICQDNIWYFDAARDNGENPFLEAFSEKTRKQFHFTAKVKNGLNALVKGSIEYLGIDADSDKITNRIVRLNIIDGFYNIQDSFE